MGCGVFNSLGTEVKYLTSNCFLNLFALLFIFKLCFK